MPYIESPYRGIGEGVGSLAAWFLTRGQREREKGVQAMIGAAERASVTGDPSELVRLLGEYGPRAASEVEKRTGIRFPTPTEAPPRQMESSTGALVNVPGSQTPPLPWPATHAGLQTRLQYEQMRVPPSPSERAVAPFKQFEGVPAQFLETAYGAARGAGAPLPELVKEPVTPPSPAEVAKFVELFKPSQEEFTTYTTEKTYPLRVPVPPPEELKGFPSITQLMGPWPDMTQPEIHDAVYNQRIPQRAPSAGTLSAQEKQLALTSQARIISSVSGEDLITVRQGLHDGTYDSTKYGAALMKAREVKGLVSVARLLYTQGKDEKAAQYYIEQLSKAMGIPWRKRKNAWQGLLELIGLAESKYGGIMEGIPSPEMTTPTTTKEGWLKTAKEKEE